MENSQSNNNNFYLKGLLKNNDERNEYVEERWGKVKNILSMIKSFLHKNTIHDYTTKLKLYKIDIYKQKPSEHSSDEEWTDCVVKRLIDHILWIKKRKYPKEVKTLNKHTQTPTHKNNLTMYTMQIHINLKYCTFGIALKRMSKMRRMMCKKRKDSVLNRSCSLGIQFREKMHF